MTLRARSGNRRLLMILTTAMAAPTEMGSSSYVSWMVIQFVRFFLGWALFSGFLASLGISLFRPNSEAVSALAFIRRGSVLS